MTTDPITTSTRAEQALTRLLRPELDAFAQHLAVLMATPDPEGPHKARVALRHMQCLLAAFAPIISKRVLHDLSTRLRLYFHDIGPLRDADVLAALHPEAAAKPDALRRRVRKRLAKHRAARLMRDANRLFRRKGWARKGRKALRLGPVTGIAAPALSKAWAVSLSHGPDLTLLAADDRHDLRKSLKSLRYLTEFFAPLWPGPALTGFLAVLPGLQYDLGQLNDQAMAKAQGLTAPDLPETLAQAQKSWQHLQAAPLWWQT